LERLYLSGLSLCLFCSAHFAEGVPDPCAQADEALMRLDDLMPPRFPLTQGPAVPENPVKLQSTFLLRMLKILKSLQI